MDQRSGKRKVNGQVDLTRRQGATVKRWPCLEVLLDRFSLEHRKRFALALVLSIGLKLVPFSQTIKSRKSHAFSRAWRLLHVFALTSD